MPLSVMPTLCAQYCARVSATRGAGHGKASLVKPNQQAKQNKVKRWCRLPDSVRVRRARHSFVRGYVTLPRAAPTEINDALLQGGPLLLPLLLSTSAALYRGATKDTKKQGTENADATTTFQLLPPGMWLGIGAVWAYWTASQAGVF
jgi:hypothetical protein